MAKKETVLQRNDPCWCGSGKKYKKCHSDFDAKLINLKRLGKRVPPRKLIKTPEQIEGIRKASAINTGLLDYIEARIKAGCTTQDIDDWTNEYLTSVGATSADYLYYGYPKSICTSINDVVCHGIPDPEVVLQEGDIINVDATSEYHGYYGDASRMYMIGEVSEEAKRLVEVTKECLEIGMKTVVPYKSTFGDIGKAIEEYAHKNGYSVVEEFTGHGIGLAMHEDPNVFHFNPIGETTYTIVPGMCFTIEPMINAGKKDICIDADDEWTVYTVDGSLSAQWEHTFLVTEDGIEILSK